MSPLSGSERSLPAALWLALLAWLFLSALLGFSGSVDDAHITFGAARELVLQGQLLNYNGERVEQSSALLQVLLLALLHRITSLDLVLLGHAFSMLSAILVFILLWRITASSRERALAVWLVATCPGFVYWSLSGMESTATAALLLATALAGEHFLNRTLAISPALLLIGAAQLSRPELVLILPAVALVQTILFAVQRAPVDAQRMALQWLALNILTALSIVLAREAWFGAMFPQPVTAKVGGDFLDRIQHGAAYALDGLTNPWLLPVALVSAVAGLLSLRDVWRGRCTPRLCGAVLLAAAYTGFVFASGGDWMAGQRFWVPVIPLFAWLSARWLVTILPSRADVAICLVVLLLGVGGAVQGLRTDYNSIPLGVQFKPAVEPMLGQYTHFERHAREHLNDMPTLAYVVPMVQRLLDAGHRPLHIMSGQMGMVMYTLTGRFPGALRILDRNALVERGFTDCPLTSSLRRTANGLGNGYAELLDRQPAMRQQCGIKNPDIVFDVKAAWNRHNVEALQRHGYVIVYQQSGHPYDDNAWLPTRRIYAGQMIAVSAAVWEALGKPQPVTVDFGMPR